MKKYNFFQRCCSSPPFVTVYSNFPPLSTLDFSTYTYVTYVLKLTSRGSRFVHVGRHRGAGLNNSPSSNCTSVQMRMLEFKHGGCCIHSSETPCSIDDAGVKTRLCHTPTDIYTYTIPISISIPIYIYTCIQHKTLVQNAFS